MGRAREGVGALPSPAASTRREGREDAGGAGWRLDRASMTSSPPSPTEAAGLERRGAGRGPAGSVSRVQPGRLEGEAPQSFGDSVRCPRAPGSCVRTHLLLQPLLSPLALRGCGGLPSPRSAVRVGLAFGRRRVCLGVFCFSETVPGTCVGCKGDTPWRPPTSLPIRAAFPFLPFLSPLPPHLALACVTLSLPLEPATSHLSLGVAREARATLYLDKRD